MRWKVKKCKQRKIGGWRVKTRFALFPVRTTMPTRDTMIWLEFYQTNDRYELSGVANYLNAWEIKQIAPRGYWTKGKKCT